MKINSVLMVCLGNICRSPMAEGILRDRNDQFQLHIDSCGTSGWHEGEPADRRSIQKLKEKGIDISDLRSRQLVRSDFENFDIIFVMDQSNFNDVTSLARNDKERGKVRMMLNEIPGFHTKNVMIHIMVVKMDLRMFTKC